MELLTHYKVAPFCQRIIETPVMMTLAAGDNITSADLEAEAFNAIANPNKFFVSVGGVDHMSLYTNCDHLAKVGRVQADRLKRTLKLGAGQGFSSVLPSEHERLYRAMSVRKTEERLARDFKAGVLPGPVHLYLGQEAVAVGVCAQLSECDWITSTHRGHGHFLAKGGDVAALFAEVYGRATGVCCGMGGSMHVADFSKGILGANGIVGGGIALAAGAALTIQRTGSGEQRSPSSATAHRARASCRKR